MFLVYKVLKQIMYPYQSSVRFLTYFDVYYTKMPDRPTISVTDEEGYQIWLQEIRPIISKEIIQGRKQSNKPYFKAIKQLLKEADLEKVEIPDE